MLQKQFDENLKKKFASRYKFANQGINKFVLLPEKGVYLYEYIDDWEKFNGISFPEQDDFYSYLNMEDITDADFRHAKEFIKILMQKMQVNIMIYMFKVIHYYQLMYSIIFKIYVLKYMNQIPQSFFSHMISMASILKVKN